MNSASMSESQFLPDGPQPSGSGVTGGQGVCRVPPPETSDREISADLPGKERKRGRGKKGKWGKKKEN